MTAPASYAKQIALDVIAQMQGDGAPTWAVSPLAAEYQRMYLDDLETMEPAGGANSEMQIVFAPIEPKTERCGTGGVHITISLGVLFNVKVAMANKVITDPNIDAYECLVDQFITWLMGPRKFAEYFSALDPVCILGDHYNEHLYEKEEFHVPVLVDFHAFVTVT